MNEKIIKHCFDNEDKELFLLIKNDTIILHVAPVFPISKDGRDEIDNYQTLCDKCNIGISNTDETDLRKKLN